MQAVINKIYAKISFLNRLLTFINAINNLGKIGVDQNKTGKRVARGSVFGEIG